jgi:hypothetical protein
MMSIKRTVERRKNKRYKAIEGAYVAISPNSQKLGQIIDISMGGVCFKYIDTSNDGQSDGTQQEDSIFLSTVGYYSGNLPIKIVGDYAVTNATSFSSMKVKKMHIQFTDFSVKQLFDLDYFLRNFVE